MESTSLSLLDRVRQRTDAESWNRLVKLYTPFLQRVLLAHGLPDGDIDDLLQEVFSTIVTEIESFDHSGNPGAFRRWLRGVLINRLRRYWQRGRARHAVSVDDMALDDLAAVTVENDELNRLWDQEHNRWLTDRLVQLIEPEFQVSTWQAFHRQVVEGATPRDVAAELGLSVNAVLIAKSRVLRRLRQELAGLLDE